LTEFGIDEGGILQAMKDPIYTRDWKEMIYDRKGNLTDEIKHHISIRPAHVAGALILYGLYRINQFDTEEKILLLTGSPLLYGIAKLWVEDPKALSATQLGIFGLYMWNEDRKETRLATKFQGTSRDHQLYLNYKAGRITWQRYIESLKDVYGDDWEAHQYGPP
jgi:hypothetical protein